MLEAVKLFPNSGILPTSGHGFSGIDPKALGSK